jgi:alkyldihydroxyacetonephosphate synthase
MSPAKPSTPAWYEGEIPANSYRALFKWGDPLAYKHPNRGLVRLMREVFDLKEEDLARPRWLGLEPLELDRPSGLTPLWSRSAARKTSAWTPARACAPPTVRG